jgi:hypothetical protein
VIADAGSQFESFSDKLKVWICETHCTEAQLKDYAETREDLAHLTAYRGSIDSLVDLAQG